MGVFATVSSMSTPEYLPLHTAAREGNVAAGLKAIKDDPKSITNVDKLNRLPIHLAAWGGKPEFIKMLLENKASVKVTAQDDVTPLLFAAQSGNAECVRLLLAKGANVNHRNSKSQKTALHLAAEKGHLEIVNILLEAGAKPHVRTVKGTTPVDVAKTAEIKQVLREACSHALEALKAKPVSEEGEETEGGGKAGEGALKRSAADAEVGEGGGGAALKEGGEEDEQEVVVAQKVDDQKNKKQRVGATLSFNLDEENEEDLL